MFLADDLLQAELSVDSVFKEQSTNELIELMENPILAFFFLHLRPICLGIRHLFVND